MISWLQIGYGAVVSGVLAAGVVAVLARPHRTVAAIAAAIATTLGAAVWNAILHVANGRQFFIDAPVAVMPASWQDTGSGVFALALAALTFGLVTFPQQPAGRVAGYAVACGLVAFGVDVYLY